MALRLRPLAIADEPEALAAQDELAPEGFEFLLGWAPVVAWPDYLATLECRRRGVEMPDGLVPATFLVAEVEGELVGRVSIRHELNAQLAAVGGHIGYGVRPQHRRHGYATEILHQALIVIRALGVDLVLVGCADDNPASAAIIERAGGILEDVALDPDGRPTRRYWIA